MASQPPVDAPARRHGWSGGLVYGGILLTLCGVLWVLEGAAALHKDKVFDQVSSGYTYQLDLTSWGTMHVVFGALCVITGVILIATSARWARIVGIVLGSICICLNFVFVVYQPAWALIMIGFAFFVVWSLGSYNPYAE